MNIPLKYNLRSLLVRWRSTLATMLGIALVVTAFILVRALAHGMEATYISTGDERNVALRTISFPFSIARFFST